MFCLCSTKFWSLYSVYSQLFIPVSLGPKNSAQFPPSPTPLVILRQNVEVVKMLWLCQCLKTKLWAYLRPVCSFQFFPAPLEILEEIFLNLPPYQVVHACRLVCHPWKEVADSESLWRERCRREGYRIRDASKTPTDWRLFYFLCKKRRNLLKNPSAERKKPQKQLALQNCCFFFTTLIFVFIDKMKNWQILENGGDNWKVERVMVPHPNGTVQENFVTSYGWVFTSSGPKT